MLKLQRTTDIAHWIHIVDSYAASTSLIYWHSFAFESKVYCKGRTEQEEGGLRRTATDNHPARADLPLLPMAIAMRRQNNVSVG